MADNNRNWQDTYRQQYGWNEDRNRQQRSYEDEPNYSITENRGHRDSGRYSGYSGMSSGDGGWQSRYERQMNTGREGDFDNTNYPRQYGRQNEGDYNYGNMNRGISSAYSDFGGDYGSRGGSRNLYDRGYQGMGRRDYENRENRLGGSNYDTYGDHGRYDDRHSRRGDSSYGGNYGRSGRDYGRGDYRQDYGRGDSDERSWWDRTTDEVSSWFGDEEAERRRDRDRYIQGHRGKGPRNYSRSDDRIKEDINDRLSDDPFIDATDIDVSVSNGEVTLTGTVDHRSTKRRAEDLAESVSGVKNIENRLRVSQTTRSESSGASGMNNPSGTSTSPTSSSPIPGSERSRTKEGSYTTK